MKIINPSVEYWSQEAGMEGVWKQIARATRVSYQSKQKEGESDLDFVKRVIFKPALIEGDLDDLEHCKFNNTKGHFSVLEHGTVYCKYNSGDIEINSPYIRTFQSMDDYKVYLTTNMRFIVENNKWWLIKYFNSNVIEYHPKRYTFNVITDIGVTREINRHRAFSITEQSTRYCDFTKDKFGGELTFIRPAWFNDSYTPISSDAALIDIYETIEDTYKICRELGWKPEQARQVLPLGLKTQAVYTAFVDDWKHFFALRSSNAVSGKAHPNMVVIADKIAEIAKEQKLW